jgi:hypothetical protein
MEALYAHHSNPEAGVGSRNLSSQISDILTLQFVMTRIREVQELGTGKESDTSPLIQRLLQFRDSSTNEPLSMETVVAEAVSHLQAVYFQPHNRHAEHHS